jgi:hypothetical protein
MEWIRAKDRLPEERELVIVADFATNRKVNLGRLEDIGCGNYQWAVGEANGLMYFHGKYFERITHWMPLPEPPKED